MGQLPIEDEGTEAPEIDYSALPEAERLSRAGAEIAATLKRYNVEIDVQVHSRQVQGPPSSLLLDLVPRVVARS